MIALSELPSAQPPVRHPDEPVGDPRRLQAKVAYYPAEGDPELLFSQSLFVGRDFSLEIQSLIRRHMIRRRLCAGRYSISWYLDDGYPVQGGSYDIIHSITTADLPCILADTDSMLINPAYTDVIPVTFHAEAHTTLRIVATLDDGSRRTLSRLRYDYVPEGPNPLGIFTADIPLTPSIAGHAVRSISVIISERESNAEIGHMRIFLTSEVPAAEISSLSQYLTPSVMQCFGTWGMDNTAEAGPYSVAATPVAPEAPEISHSVEITSEPLDTFAAAARQTIGAAIPKADVRLFMGSRQISFPAIITRQQTKTAPSDQTKITHTITLRPATPSGTIPGPSDRPRIFTQEYTSQFQ